MFERWAVRIRRALNLFLLPDLAQPRPVAAFRQGSTGDGGASIGRPAAREVENGAGRKAAFLAAGPGDHGDHLVQAHEAVHGQGGDEQIALALGRLPTGDALLATARAAGARTAVVTTAPEKVEGADLTLHLPGRTMADPPCPDLPLGSGFELALSLFFDLTVVELVGRLGLGNADIAKRHANLL